MGKQLGFKTICVEPGFVLEKLILVPDCDRRTGKSKGKDKSR